MINLFLSLRVESISLGQGQGPIAEKIIHAAMKTGKWVFLQNCHLAVSWMLAMEELIKTFTEPGITHIDTTFTQFRCGYCPMCDYIVYCCSSSWMVYGIMDSWAETSKQTPLPIQHRSNTNRLYSCVAPFCCCCASFGQFVSFVVIMHLL